MKTGTKASLATAAEGAATVEFAFVAIFLCTLLLGLTDFGIGFWEQMQVANAVGAGANYVMANGYTSNTDVQNAMSNATNLSGINLGAPAKTCGCPTSSGIKAVALGTYPTCGSSCSGVAGATGTSLPYVTITASVSYSTIFTWPGIGNPITLSSTAYAPN